MAKRFIDSGLFMDEWFFELDDKAKLFWIYYLTNCDHAGFLPFNKKLIAFQIGCDPNSIETVLKQFDNRIRTVKDGLLFCPKFIRYQYSNGLSEKAPAQKSVIELLKRNGVNPTTLEQLPNSLETVQDKDKDKDIDEDTEKQEEEVSQKQKEMNINSEMTKIWKASNKRYVWNTDKDSFAINLLRENITKQLKQIGEDPHFPIAEESIITKWQELIQNRNEYWLKQDLSMMANYFNRFESECKPKSNKRGMVY